MALKASAIEDQKRLSTASEEARLDKAHDYFMETLGEISPQDNADTMTKGIGNRPLDMAYLSPYFEYLMFVYGQRKAIYQVEDLYQKYLKIIPESRRTALPIQMLSALMVSKLRQEDYEGVIECWNVAFKQAEKQAQPMPGPPIDPNGSRKILPSHQLSLCIPLSTYMQALARQNRMDELSNTIDELTERGFSLDNKNWNLFVQLLARTYHYKQAFEVCEAKLMDGWTGWAQTRWMQPVRNRLPIELRRERKQPLHIKPVYHTLLYLARALLDLQASAAESKHASNVLGDLEHGCSKTLHAIAIMHRTDDLLEREVLHGDGLGL